MSALSEYEPWAFHSVLSWHFVLILLSLFLLIFFLCPIGKFRVVTGKKCSLWVERSSGMGWAEVAWSPLLGVFRACPHKAISNPIWFWCWPFLEQEVGLCCPPKVPSNLYYFMVLFNTPFPFWFIPDAVHVIESSLCVGVNPICTSIEQERAPEGQRSCSGFTHVGSKSWCKL